jgi:hypothetical protein
LPVDVIRVVSLFIFQVAMVTGNANA